MEKLRWAGSGLSVKAVVWCDEGDEQDHMIWKIKKCYPMVCLSLVLSFVKNDTFYVLGVVFVFNLIFRAS